MLRWIQRVLSTPPSQKELTPDEAVEALRGLESDAEIDEIWDALDSHATVVEASVRSLVEDDQLGEWPMHAAVLWLCYQRGNHGRMADEPLVGRLRDAIVWAFGFETNHVLTGGALGALDALEPDVREETALSVFHELGAESSRRYWLLMKVRTDDFLAAVADSLQEYTPEKRRSIVGSFRQFRAGDLPVLLNHADLDSPGADLWLEALGATRTPDALPAIRDALGDERSQVREAAYRAIELIKAQER